MVLLLALLGLVVVTNVSVGIVLALRYLQDRRDGVAADAASERVRPVAIALAAGRVPVGHALDSVAAADLPVLDRQLLYLGANASPEVAVSVPARVASATGWRSAWYDSSSSGLPTPCCTSASFHARLNASWIPMFMPWPPAGLWMWAASPARNTRPVR